MTMRHFFNDSLVLIAHAADRPEGAQLGLLGNKIIRYARCAARDLVGNTFTWSQMQIDATKIYLSKK